VIILPVAGWLQRQIFGLLFSLSDAIITNTSMLILELGLIGGLSIGVVVSAFTV
jgi:hypothetical protein